MGGNRTAMKPVRTLAICFISASYGCTQCLDTCQLRYVTMNQCLNTRQLRYPMRNLHYCVCLCVPGTMNPATFLRVLGPEPWSVCYAEPSVRPDDSRYGNNPNRVQRHTQFQVSACAGDQADQLPGAQADSDEEHIFISNIYNTAFISFTHYLCIISTKLRLCGCHTLQTGLTHRAVQ